MQCGVCFDTTLPLQPGCPTKAYLRRRPVATEALRSRSDTVWSNLNEVQGTTVTKTVLMSNLDCMRAFVAQSWENHWIPHHKTNKTDRNSIYRKEDSEKQRIHGTSSNSIGAQNESCLLSAIPGACQSPCTPFRTPLRHPHPCTPGGCRRVDCTRPSVETPDRNPGNENPPQGEQLQRGG